MSTRLASTETPCSRKPPPRRRQSGMGRDTRPARNRPNISQRERGGCHRPHRRGQDPNAELSSRERVSPSQPLQSLPTVTVPSSVNDPAGACRKQCGEHWLADREASDDSPPSVVTTPLCRLSNDGRCPLSRTGGGGSAADVIGPPVRLLTGVAAAAAAAPVCHSDRCK